jgi:hypothetical protein
MAKAKSAPKKAVPAKKAAEKKAAAKKAPAKKAPEKKTPEKKAPAPKVLERSLEAENLARQALETLLNGEIEGLKSQLTDAASKVESLTAELEAAQTELKLAQSKLKEKVDRDWASQAGEQDLNEAREQGRKADKAAEAARAEAAVLRGEIDRLRAQLHGKDSRPPTLQGVGDPTPTPTGAREENAPQKAMPADETTKNPDENKPGFWGRLFKKEKE